MLDANVSHIDEETGETAHVFGDGRGAAHLGRKPVPQSTHVHISPLP